MNDMNLYPLVLEPILKEKVWGGRKLAAFGKKLPEGAMIGESWELADLSSTSASGGGGDAAISVIRNGAMQGKTIRHAISAWGEGMLGGAKLSAEGGFPLLVKYLDAREHLSVQVHPSPAYAAEHSSAHLKTESWFVLDADEGAVIYKGLKEGVTRADLQSTIENGTVPEVMRSEAAVVGACHTLESGTVHALGAGVLVAEVQTPSDTTYRVYDWASEYGREGRELHIEQAVECASFEAPSVGVSADLSISSAKMGMGGPPKMGSVRTRVSGTDFYTMDVLSASCSEVSLVEGDQKGPVVLMVPKTMGASLASRSGGFDEVILEAGQTVLVPAGIASDCVLRAGPGTVAVVAGVV
ncbi:MAG: class I mannose-6-phosphate isomerase [Phycisphaerales bacterium]|nr:class I mannose-6-phosphate isomerase [Phycisphaerales bacterium]